MLRLEHGVLHHQAIFSAELISTSYHGFVEIWHQELANRVQTDLSVFPCFRIRLSMFGSLGLLSLMLEMMSHRSHKRAIARIAILTFHMISLSMEHALFALPICLVLLKVKFDTVFSEFEASIVFR